MEPIFTGQQVQGSQARQLSGDALKAALRDSRRRTLAWSCDLNDTQWRMQPRAGLNPLAWELAHIAWFAEFWVLRGPHHVNDNGRTQAALPWRCAGPDALLDSSLVPHDQRWALALPDRAGVLGMMESQLEACIDAVPAGQDDHALYFHRLALFHEDMHGEALAWMRSALAYRAPPGTDLSAVLRAAAVPGTSTVPWSESATVTLPGGAVRLGTALGGSGFAFDNELPGKETTLRAFEIDRCLVTNADFLRFVEAGGYGHAAYWPGPAGAWRHSAERTHPAHWRRKPQHSGAAPGSDAGWEMRWFDTWCPLEPALPAMHLCAFEAEAYCLWAGRRLPSAAQWEHAADHMAWGRSVWEWTRDAFEPHPGFAAGPYRDYSAPWFGNHRELRGGAFATHARLHDRRYRNFFMPHRDDVFAGFRTVDAGI